MSSCIQEPLETVSRHSLWHGGRARAGLQPISGPDKLSSPNYVDSLKKALDLLRSRVLEILAFYILTAFMFINT
ncbi:hypothetical protein RRG08_062337 [Elysia crispata]|uniref:Uncharacterized protein n=1 Tax=Elysia crispata TaxID=231223 RepID=A0AAE0YGE7_9GAST|nr:hypothetical protein RRG08_062337 [Elysia crispata]